jgi:hypothetical protein
MKPQNEQTMMKYLFSAALAALALSALAAMAHAGPVASPLRQSASMAQTLMPMQDDASLLHMVRHGWGHHRGWGRRGWHHHHHHGRFGLFFFPGPYYYGGYYNGGCYRHCRRWHGPRYCRRSCY